MEGPEQNFIMT